MGINFQNSNIQHEIYYRTGIFSGCCCSYPAVNTCEEKNDMLKNALVRLAKKNMAKEDCSTCFDDILAAVVDCFFSGSWLQCVEDVLGAGNPCINCVCEVITEVCAVVGCDWGC